MSKIKICVYLSLQPTDGGKYQYSVNLLEAFEQLQENNYSISIMYLNENWKVIIRDKFDKSVFVKKNIIIRIIRKTILFFPFGLNIWRIVSKYIDPIYKTIKSTNPNLVFYPGNDSLAYEFDFPSVVPIFDLMHRYESNFPEVMGEISKLRDRHYKNVSKYAKAILVDSEVGKKQVIESYHTNGKKIFVLPYTAPNYVKMEVNSDKVLAKYNLPGKFIFYPAQFWAHKNHLNLLKAIQHLKQKGLIINAVFVGSQKNMHSQINKKIEELELVKQIQILNYVANTELVALYKKAVALVMPTFFGPTNIPPLEAFALGCPVITSNIYGILEQVGDAALLVNPNDPNDIVEKIEMIWMDKKVRDSLIEKGYEQDEIHSKDNFVERLVNIIENTI